MSLSLISPAFAANTMIPIQYTCQGADISPALLWQDAPAETKSYVLILDDPDAPSGDWVHWVVFNIPPTVQRLADDAELPAGAINGKNSWGQTGYRGPCPPSGTHRYFFKLYALDMLLTLNANATKQDVLAAMANHVLEQSELMGLYRKQ
ncbi:YbhB/YbcL family Raf kinase inhibitor-like protein [Legionella tunisiensis]|uniref:YbhB/YbcL family Raf kinase inhibitor-like protein n=1 Tax=Legionella tunisiensis TaxID=1034944 RepID=UPI0002F6C452|nr:YbhB/YbcL family Raf kinase inhibitor-like protein [Legionella tunisiensis]